MKAQLFCFECNKPIFEGLSDPSTGFKIQFLYEAITDNGVYNFRCPNGHDGFAIDQNHKFQVLFDSGVRAFVDGYFREAVSSVWAALERFYEYGSLVILDSFGVTPDQLEKTMKETKNQSERQIGAFYFLYNLRFGTPLQFLSSDKDFGFRNNVIHKGYFPKEKETYDFIERVYNHITDVLSQFHAKHKKSMDEILGFEMGKKSNSIGKGAKSSTTMCWPLTINCIATSNPTDVLVINSLKDKIAELGKSKYILQ